MAKKKQIRHRKWEAYKAETMRKTMSVQLDVAQVEWVYLQAQKRGWSLGRVVRWCVDIVKDDIMDMEV